MQTLRQLIREHRPAVRRGDIAQAIADEVGKPISDQSISNYLSGIRPWPARFVGPLHQVLTDAGLDMTRQQLLDLVAMTQEDIDRIEREGDA